MQVLQPTNVSEACNWVHDVAIDENANIRKAQCDYWELM